MKQPLHDYWTIDVDSTFSRRTTDDGFVVFEGPGISLWAIVYIVQDFNPHEAIRCYVKGWNFDDCELVAKREDNGIAGRAYLSKEDGEWKLTAFASAYARIVELRFCCEVRNQVETAIEVWRSVVHSYPAWIRMCSEASPPLAELRECLERGWQIPAALNRAEENGQTEIALAVLIEAASHSDRMVVRRSACEALALVGGDEALQTLRDRLDDDSVDVRAWAADGLLELGEPPETVVPAMIEGMQVSEPPLPKGEDRIGGICKYLSVPERYHAARILSNVGEAALPARQLLLDHQMDESEGVRIRVAEALLNCGEPMSNILPPLLDGLTNPDMSARERMRFVEPLLEYGVAHETLLPPLIQTITDSSDYSAVCDALRGIRQIGPPAKAAADAIGDRIVSEGEDFNNATLAAQTLAVLGEHLDIAVPILQKALDHPRIDDYDKAEILEDLSEVISLDDSILERIAVDLNHENPYVKVAAAEVLAANGDRSRNVLEILIDALTNDDDETRWRAAVRLGGMGADAGEAVEPLTHLIANDECRAVRMAGVWAAGCIGQRTDQLVQVLAEAMKDATADDQNNIQQVQQRLTPLHSEAPGT